jgi:hypothetical protein
MLSGDFRMHKFEEIDAEGKGEEKYGTGDVNCIS